MLGDIGKGPPVWHTDVVPDIMPGLWSSRVPATCVLWMLSGA